MRTTKLKICAGAILVAGLLTTGLVVQHGQELTSTKTNSQVADSSKTQGGSLLASQSEQETARTSLEETLRQSVSLNFGERPLAEVIQAISRSNDISITLARNLLENQTIKNLPVTIRVHKTALATALKFALEPLDLTYKIEGETIQIRTRESQQTFEKSYYVGDLVGSQPSERSHEQSRPKADLNPLINLITSTVAPGSWRPIAPDSDMSESWKFIVPNVELSESTQGNRTIGSITSFDLSVCLVIRHTQEEHEKIANLLYQLRHVQSHRLQQIPTHAPGTPCPAEKLEIRSTVSNTAGSERATTAPG